MSSLRLEACLGRQRRRFAVLVVIVALAGAVAVAHSGPMGDHVNSGVGVCLAVVALGGAALIVRRSCAENRRRAPFIAMAA